MGLHLHLSSSPPFLMLHIPIDLRICKVINHIAFSFRILGRHVALSAAGQLKTKARKFSVKRESKPLGDYIMNFTDQNMCRVRKRSPESTRGAHEVGGAPSRVGRALHSRGGLWSLSDYFFLPKILKYSKTDKNCL